MAKTLEQERAAIAAEQNRLDARLKLLEDRERQNAIIVVEKAGLLKLEPKKLARIVDRIKTLGPDEAQKRLGA
ncbi:hypothetical protein H5V43_21860 (plasmid) [Sphingobium fuliginis]|uniref:Uncharacterized protein n=2 Tax=Sphingobium fuliginis (strain ATCC 27551) TaxID=336203 RepID=A0A7M2GQJ0_SPHSA|nr:hypothetical protein [Sphingobium estronivorans]QOT74605.1 hypothetical protein H5V43_21860 [Sphingobium fuliginis]